MERFKKFVFLPIAYFLSSISFACKVNLYAKSFKEMGIPQEKIAVTGNMKFDGDYAKLPAQQLDAWRSELGI